MNKNKHSANSLLKMNHLTKILNKEGVKRISPDAYLEFERLINKEIVKLSKILAQKIIIRGKKTLEIEDIKEVFEEKEIDYPEI